MHVTDITDMLFSPLGTLNTMSLAMDWLVWRDTDCDVSESALTTKQLMRSAESNNGEINHSRSNRSKQKTVNT